MTRDKKASLKAGVARPRQSRGRLKRFAAYSALLIIVGIGAFTAFAWQPAIPAGQTTATSSFSPILIEQGAHLSAEGFCASCHTVAGGQPFGGG